ncbi:MAG: hypothetical protein AB7F35_20310 [Acetobacteraceae bacterium]
MTLLTVILFYALLLATAAAHWIAVAFGSLRDALADAVLLFWQEQAEDRS